MKSVTPPSPFGERVLAEQVRGRDFALTAKPNLPYSTSLALRLM